MKATDAASSSLSASSAPSSPSLRTRRALLLAGLLGPVLLVAWWTRAASDLPYLGGDGPGSWIVHPVEARVPSRPLSPVVVHFAKEFQLSEPEAPAEPAEAAEPSEPAEPSERAEPTELPSSTTLTWRTLGAGRLSINGVVLGESDGRTPVELDVARALRRGMNRLEVSVENAAGPPALALEFELQTATALKVIASGADWTSSIAGLVWRPVRLARASARPASLAPRSEETLPLSARAAFVLVVATIGWAASRSRRLMPFDSGAVSLGLAALVVTGWGALFVSSMRIEPAFIGFDVTHHVEYLKFVLAGRLPLPTDGVQTYHPPLFYVLSSGLVRIFGIEVPSEAAGRFLRAFTFALGLINVLGLVACVRTVWPERRDLASLALIFAACLPLHLVLAHTFSNETLVAPLSTLCALLVLRLLRAAELSLAGCVGLGVALGSALLAKVSALLLAPVALGALLVAHPRRAGRIALAAAVMLFVCAGYYGRIAWIYGTPLVSNWDPVVGFSWWQDPGYRTSASFLRFGVALTEPWYAGFVGVWDGLFSTLFADGLASGARNRRLGPARDFEFMGAAAALGLVPAALAGLGALRALRGAWRRPEPTSLFLIGLGVAAVLAYVYVNLRVPSYAQSKALYVSPALVVGIVAFAHGWDAIRARSRAAGSICVALLLLWAVLSAGAFRVGSDLAALRSRGEKALAAGDAELALEHFEAAAASGGEGWPRVGRCRALAMAGRSSAALSLCRAALAAEPDDADALFHTANLEARSGRPAAALELYEQLATLAPRDDRAHPKIAWLRAQLGDIEGARRAASEWLRFDPSNPTALAFATSGRAP